VLAIVIVVAGAVLGIGAVLVHVDDPGAVVGILIGPFEHVPGVGRGGGVGDFDVAVDDVVQGGANGLGIGVIHRIVITDRGIGEGPAGGEKQDCKHNEPCRN